jgi:hypothetical protein
MNVDSAWWEMDFGDNQQLSSSLTQANDQIGSATELSYLSMHDKDLHP